jgi:hypothetical protein
MSKPCNQKIGGIKAVYILDPAKYVPLIGNDNRVYGFTTPPKKPKVPKEFRAIINLINKRIDEYNRTGEEYAQELDNNEEAEKYLAKVDALEAVKKMILKI